MDPPNVSLCRTHLGLPVAAEAATTELVRRVREAVAEVTDSWSFRLAERTC